MSEPRRWPVDRLDAIGRSWLALYAERHQMTYGTARKFLSRLRTDKGGLLTTQEADEMAHAAGIHPFFIWPDWCDPPFHGCEDDDLWGSLEDAS